MAKTKTIKELINEFYDYWMGDACADMLPFKDKEDYERKMLESFLAWLKKKRLTKNIDKI